MTELRLKIQMIKIVIEISYLPGAGDIPKPKVRGSSPLGTAMISKDLRTRSNRLVSFLSPAPTWCQLGARRKNYLLQAIRRITIGRERPRQDVVGQGRQR